MIYQSDAEKDNILSKTKIGIQRKFEKKVCFHTTTNNILNLAKFSTRNCFNFCRSKNCLRSEMGFVFLLTMP